MVQSNVPEPVSWEVIREVLGWDHSSATLVISDILGSAKRGEIWPDNKGLKRLILFIDRGTSSVWFLMGDKGYRQSWEGFRGDVGVGNIQQRTAAGMAATQKFIEIVMGFIEGVTGGMYFPMWLAWIGKDIAVFVSKHYNEFPKWEAAGRFLLMGRQILKTHAPTLYDTIFDVAAWNFMSRMPTAATEISSEDASKIFGGVCGGVTKVAMKGAVTMVKAILTALRVSATRAVIPVTGSTLKGSTNPKVIIDALRSVRRDLKPHVIEKISREYQANPIMIPKAIQYIQDGLGVMVTLMESKPP